MSASSLLPSLPNHDVLSFTDLSTYALDEQAWIQRLVHPGQNVLDIGASVGLFSKRMADRVGPEGMVFSFEPYTPLYNCLVYNTKTQSNIRVIRCLLGDRIGEVCLMCPRVTPSNAESRCVSLDVAIRSAQQDSHTLGCVTAELPLQGETEDKPLPYQKSIRGCVTLDSIEWGDPDPEEPGRMVPLTISFVRIALQGFEYRILKGASGFIRTHRPVLLIKTEDAKLQRYGHSVRGLVQLLNTWGYQVEQLDTNPHPRPEVRGTRPHLYLATPRPS
jgi:FkbM family methyltransferase